MSSSPLRVLGLGHAATKEEIKLAYRALAKKWHPDRHQGPAKVKAEEMFKQISQAYESLTNGQPGMGGAASSSAHDRRPRSRAGPGRSWSRYAAGADPNFNPYESYMGFGKDGKGHWYEDIAEQRAKEESSKSRKMWASMGLFGLLLYACVHTNKRDKKAKERGELVDAWYNQA